MVATGKIVNRDVIIKNELGLHARSAAQIDPDGVFGIDRLAASGHDAARHA